MGAQCLTRGSGFKRRATSSQTTVKEKTGHPTACPAALRPREAKSTGEKTRGRREIITGWWNYRELSPLYTWQIVYNETRGF